MLHVLKDLEISVRRGWGGDEKHLANIFETILFHTFCSVNTFKVHFSVRDQHPTVSHF